MLNDPLNIISLTGDGVQTVFDVPFKIWDVAELEVSVLTASGASTVVSDWTATISPGGLGGTVTYPTAGDPLPSGDKIVVRRVVPIQQKVDLIHANRVLPDVVENALDRLTAMVAQNAEEVDRAVKGAPGQTATDYLNEIDADRAAAELAAQNAQAAQTAAEQAQTAAETAAGNAEASAIRAETAAEQAELPIASPGEEGKVLTVSPSLGPEWAEVPEELPPYSVADEGKVLKVSSLGETEWGAVAGMPVGALLFSTTGTPLPGTVPVNVKQKFALEVYPQLEAWVRSSGDYLATEAEWDAEAAAQEGSCGRYCLTDTHIILPCYKHYFAAAQDGVAGKGVGDWAGDAIRNITGQSTAALYSATDARSGAITLSDVVARYNIGIIGDGTGGEAMRHMFFDSSRVVPTAEENRPKTSYLLPCIKVADVAVNAAQVDMQALAAQVAAINGNKVDRSEWTQSLGESGWQKLPSGLILQWGKYAGGSYAPTINFPIAFPNAALSMALVSVKDNDAVALTYLTSTSFRASQIDIYNNVDSGSDFFWQAIGH